jgi:hypothetical protein
MSTTTTTPPKQDGEDQVLERLQRLVQRAEQGDEAVLPELTIKVVEEEEATVNARCGEAGVIEGFARPKIIDLPAFRTRHSAMLEELAGIDHVSSSVATTLAHRPVCFLRSLKVMAKADSPKLSYSSTMAS